MAPLPSSRNGAGSRDPKKSHAVASNDNPATMRLELMSVVMACDRTPCWIVACTSAGLQRRAIRLVSPRTPATSDDAPSSVGLRLVLRRQPVDPKDQENEPQPRQQM